MRVKGRIVYVALYARSSVRTITQRIGWVIIKEVVDKEEEGRRQTRA